MDTKKANTLLKAHDDATKGLLKLQTMVIDEINKSGYTQEYLRKQMNISRDTFFRKKRNLTFKSDELRFLVNILT